MKVILKKLLVNCEMINEFELSRLKIKIQYKNPFQFSRCLVPNHCGAGLSTGHGSPGKVMDFTVKVIDF